MLALSVEEVQKKTLALLEEFLFNTNYKVLALVPLVLQFDTRAYPNVSGLC
jgi:hypothetical protein